MKRPNPPSRSLMFPAAPNVDCYSAVGSVEAAKSRLAGVIDDAEGVGLVVGPAGTGKSLLCCLLAESLKDDFHVVLLADSQLTTGETLLKHILFHMNLPYRDLSEGELRLSLIDHLTQGMRGSSKSALALIIDEAQTLSTRMLEEIRMITNIVRDGQPRVRTILAGGPELEDRLCDPKLESLNQRISTRCYLHPLTVGEMARYVHDAAMRAGINPGFLIDDGALHVVHQATSGIPRLVNQLMRQVIAASPAETIRAEHVNRAWQALQQLPSPLTDDETNALSPVTSVDVLRETDIVEFGELTAESRENVSQVETEPRDQHENEPAGDAGPAEPIDPIAEANPAVAADLERVTESLQRLAADHSEDLTMTWDDEPVVIDSSVPSPQEAVLPLEELFGADFDEEETLTTERNYGTPLASSLSLPSETASDTELEDEVHERIIEMIDTAPETLAFRSTPTSSSELHLHEDIQLSDDSDLLVIEESVDLEPVRVRPPLFDDDPSDSQDYQALLNRMREG